MDHELDDKDVRVMRRFRRNLRSALGGKAGQAVLEKLHARFGVDLPCFQGGRGRFDPLDAMRRDAYRELILWLERQLAISKTERAESSDDEDFL